MASRPKHLQQQAWDGANAVYASLETPEWEVYERLPLFFWEDPQNHNRYFEWLGRKLGFEEPQDWYALTFKDIERYRGQGFLACYDNSRLQMLRTRLPDFDWKPWLFRQAPTGFWYDKHNCRDFCEWYAERSGIKDLDDWYGVTSRTLSQNHGGGLMAIYDCSISAMLADVYPSHDWLPWRFTKTPTGFWHTKANRLRYVKWLGDQLNYRSTDDWYQLDKSVITSNFGGSLYQYGYSAQSILRELKPNKKWLPWLFALVPDGFWEDKANRIQYLRWLGKQLGYRSAEDWLGVTLKDFAKHRGSVVFQFVYGGDASLAIKELYPESDVYSWQLRQVPVGSWDDADFCRRYLQWAAEQLGVNTLDGWYGVTKSQMRSLPAGGGFLRRFRTLAHGLATAFPRHHWLPWMFQKIPDGFWSDEANLHRYLRWLGDKLGLKTSEHWMQLTAKQLRSNYGGGLIAKMKVTEIRLLGAKLSVR